VRNHAIIEQLMQTKLANFYPFWSNNKQAVLNNNNGNVIGSYSSNVSIPNTSQISDSSFKLNTDL
jgi:hypothetical protein